MELSVYDDSLTVYGVGNQHKSDSSHYIAMQHLTECKQNKIKIYTLNAWMEDDHFYCFLFEYMLVVVEL